MNQYTLRVNYFVSSNLFISVHCIIQLWKKLRDHFTVSDMNHTEIARSGIKQPTAM